MIVMYNQSLKCRFDITKSLSNVDENINKIHILCACHAVEFTEWIYFNIFFKYVWVKSFN